MSGNNQNLLQIILFDPVKITNERVSQVSKVCGGLDTLQLPLGGVPLDTLLFVHGMNNYLILDGDHIMAGDVRPNPVVTTSDVLRQGIFFNITHQRRQVRPDTKD